VRVARNVANDRQVITIIELDVPAGEVKAAIASLTLPDALARLAEIVETTQLEGVYEDSSPRSRPNRVAGPGWGPSGSWFGSAWCR